MTEQTNDTRTPLAEGGNPADYTVAEVTEYLDAEGTTDDERRRILEAERDGQGRTTLLGANGEALAALQAPENAEGDPQDPQGAPEPSTGEQDPAGGEHDHTAPTTRGGTFASAAERATPHAVGYLGYSPAREAAGGKADKGLSQQSILRKG